MNYFESKVAIVTGGASGIGRALSEELGRRGAAAVVVADVNAEGAQEVAAASRRAQAMHVDVSREEGVQALVDETISRHGRLDLMVNNAGIVICGEVRDMTLDHWRRMLDVNLWGVIYGTTAAYRVMVGQGFGHIVNVASLDGLTPMPLATPYTAAKHAVVGLSTALRIEGAKLGVKVSVVCPGTVQTNILDTAAFVGIKREEAIAEMQSGFKIADPADCARAILRGVERNQAIIIDARLNRLLWWLYRLSPSLYAAMMQKGVEHMRPLRRGPTNTMEETI
ncbi:MAG: SDR family oxidoreductase [Anaerolineae bacterium]|nr:SDR family oxidoreductase [Anaerolineae bacterium]